MIDITYLQKRNYLKNLEIPRRPCGYVDCQEKQIKTDNPLKWVKVSDKEIKKNFSGWF